MATNKISEVQKAVFKTALDKGWWDKPREVGTCLALIHSEISEAMEEARVHPVDHKYKRVSDGKPEGFVVELADAVIRIMDLCEYYELDLEAAILEKMGFNESRPYRHGGKKA